MENKNVVSFADFTKENMYKVSPEGKFEKQEWSYYKDSYPEKYDLVDGEKQLNSFSWVIKQNDKKIAVLSDQVDETSINGIIQILQSKKS